MPSVSLAGAAQAVDSFPTKPVRLIVSWAAGGGPDIQARQFEPKFAEALGQPVVVENKVGAAGVLAAQYVAQSAPDGYTVLLGANTHLMQKHLNPQLRFDPLKDFKGVANFMSSPTVLVVRAD